MSDVTHVPGFCGCRKTLIVQDGCKGRVHEDPEFMESFSLPTTEDDSIELVIGADGQVRCRFDDHSEHRQQLAETEYVVRESIGESIALILC